jgi:hypothetical protein
MSIILVLSIVLSGCSQGSGNTKSVSNNSTAKTTTAPPMDVVVDKISSAIGTQGGEVDLKKEGVKLVVPAGALTSNSSIVVKQLSNPQGFGPTTIAYDLTGLTALVKPITLVFTTEKGFTSEELEVLGYDIQTQKASTIPYTYDSVTGDVTVTIDPAQSSAKNINHGTSLPPSEMKMMMSPTQSAEDNRSYTYKDEFRVTVKTDKTYHAKSPDHLIQMPFYEQSGGSCGANDVMMLLRAYGAPDIRLNQGEVLKAIGVSDTDYGITEASVFGPMKSYIEQKLGLSGKVMWDDYRSATDMKSAILENLDNDKPMILEFPNQGTGHWALVIGYRDSGNTIIIQDSKGMATASGVDAKTGLASGIDGSMYTVRSWSWMESAMSITPLIFPSYALWVDVSVDPAHTLQTFGLPAGNDTSPLGPWDADSKFYIPITSPTSGKVNKGPVAVLQFRPSEPQGYRWGVATDLRNSGKVTTIPVSSQGFYLRMPVWNTDRASSPTVTVDTTISAGNQQVFSNTSSPLVLDIAKDNTTNMKLVEIDVPLTDPDPQKGIRRLDLADSDGNEPINIDVVLKKDGAVCDSFSLEATLSLRPQISKLVPNTAPPGTPVTINGFAFGTKTSKCKVTVAGTDAKVSYWSDQQIEISVPDDAKGGDQPVVVTNDRFSSDPVNLHVQTIAQTISAQGDKNNSNLPEDAFGNIDNPFPVSISGTVNADPSLKFEGVEYYQVYGYSHNVMAFVYSIVASATYNQLDASGLTVKFDDPKTKEIVHTTTSEITDPNTKIKTTTTVKKTMTWQGWGKGSYQATGMGKPVDWANGGSITVKGAALPDSSRKGEGYPIGFALSVFLNGSFDIDTVTTVSSSDGKSDVKEDHSTAHGYDTIVIRLVKRPAPPTP